jgi:hypothetical protein
MPKLKMVCAECGSEDVLADAYVGWNKEAQGWEIANVFGKGDYCNNCEGECRIEQKEDES